MMKLIRTAALFTLAVAFLAGCAQQPPAWSPFAPGDGSSMLQGDAYIQKADNYLIVFDASQSMTEKFMGGPKFDLAKQFVSSMNQSLPGFDMKGGVRSFGHANAFTTQPRA